MVMETWRCDPPLVGELRTPPPHIRQWYVTKWYQLLNPRVDMETKLAMQHNAKQASKAQRLKDMEPAKYNTRRGMFVARKNAGSLFNPLLVFAVIFGRIAVFSVKKWKLSRIGSLEPPRKGGFIDWSQPSVILLFAVMKSTSLMICYMPRGYQQISGAYDLGYHRCCIPRHMPRISADILGPMP